MFIIINIKATLHPHLIIRVKVVWIYFHAQTVCVSKYLIEYGNNEAAGFLLDIVIV